MPAVKVDDSALLGALVAFKSLDKDVQKETAKATRTTLTPLWRNIVATRLRVAQRSVSSRQDSRMAGKGTASVSSGGKGTLRVYTSGVALSGGMAPGSNWPWVEFGTKRPGYAGTRLPQFTPGGRIGYPAVKAWAPTAARVWFAVIADTIRATGYAEDA